MDCGPGPSRALFAWKRVRRRCEQITEMFQGVNHGNSPHPVETNPEAAFFVVFQQQHDATIEVASSTRLS